MSGFDGYSPDEVRRVAAPTLVAIGDADLIRPEAALALLRLLGGAPEDGGMGARPASQLAVLPGTSHFEILYRTALLGPIIEGFLGA